ncbi:hypothetical protein P7C70_g495, partial [Phenoliferia sp. Uapishka_3]
MFGSPSGETGGSPSSKPQASQTPVATRRIRRADAPPTPFSPLSPTLFGSPSSDSGRDSDTAGNLFSRPEVMSEVGETVSAPSPSALQYGGLFSSGFGAQSKQTRAPGTAYPSYQPTVVYEPHIEGATRPTAGQTPHHFQSICLIEAYKDFSCEELRWEDYQANRKISQAPGWTTLTFPTTPAKSLPAYSAPVERPKFQNPVPSSYFSSAPEAKTTPLPASLFAAPPTPDTLKAIGQRLSASSLSKTTETPNPFSPSSSAWPLPAASAIPTPQPDISTPLIPTLPTLTPPAAITPSQFTISTPSAPSPFKTTPPPALSLSNTKTKISLAANLSQSPAPPPPSAEWTRTAVVPSTPSASSAPKVDLTESRYSKERGRMMTLINALTASGASLELDVPRIAIIGNQSAGKSSLVEAISGIAVPRDAGTCTRTPYEVQLKSSPDPWSCRISLRTVVDQEGESDKKTYRQLSFGDVLQDPAQVEPMLRKAQLALLHPGSRPDFFIDLDQVSTDRINNGELPPGCQKKLSFSKNLVCVEIQGPEAVDLTFVDLPGIISNVKPGDDPNDIKLVRNLAKEHITGNCLILCAFTMKDELDNQSAGQLAREADPDGTRTIGVLTKADTLQEGEHEDWLKVLRGEDYQLRLGYFCTRLRGTSDLRDGGTSYEVSRAAESAFFSTVAPWNSLIGEIRHRLGTKRLVDFLGDQLSHFMSTKIPELISKTSTQLADLESQLAKLPPCPSGDPVIRLGSSINDFVTALERFSAGAAGSKTLIQNVNEVFDNFVLDIQATEPRFTPFAGDSERRTQWEEEVVAIRSGDEGGDVGPARAAHQKRRVKELGTKFGGIRAEEFLLEMDLREVQSRINNARTRELPMSVPYDAKIDLIAQALRGWPSIVEVCLERVRPIVHQNVHQLVSTHFAIFDQGALCAMVHTSMSTHIDELFTTCRKQLDYFVKLEQKVATTRNKHYLVSTYENLVGLFNAARKDPPAKELVDALLAAGLASGKELSRQEVIKMLNGEDFFEEIDVMASVQAYWKVAYKRFIDFIPRAVDGDIVQGLHEDARQLLISRVGLYDSDASERAEKLVSENQSITKERNELLGRVERLKEARELLSKFDVENVA